MTIEEKRKLLREFIKVSKETDYAFGRRKPYPDQYRGAIAKFRETIANLISNMTGCLWYHWEQKYDAHITDGSVYFALENGKIAGSPMKKKPANADADFYYISDNNRTKSKIWGLELSQSMAYTIFIHIDSTFR